MINNIIINHIDFDNYKNHIMISTNKGFIIYSILPFNQKYFMEIKGGIRFGYIHSFEKKIFILNKINPIPIDNVTLSNDKIILWNQSIDKEFSNINIKKPIIQMNISKMRNNLLFATNNNIYQYHINNNLQFVLIQTINTYINILSSYIFNDNYIMFTTNSNEKGYITIKSNTKFYKIKPVNSDINNIAVNSQGTLLATTSINGYSIKVFETINGTFLKEFKRGNFRRNITTLNFSDNSNFLICGTINGTLHMFLLGNENFLDYRTFWGISERGKYIYSFKDMIIAAYYIENRNIIYVLTSKKIYLCRIIDNKIEIFFSSLILYCKDPFIKSPDIRKNTKTIPINKNKTELLMNIANSI